jgi:hypothetical protein
MTNNQQGLLLDRRVLIGEAVKIPTGGLNSRSYSGYLVAGIIPLLRRNEKRLDD